MSGAGLAPVFPDDALLNSQEPHDQWTARMPLDDISDEVVFSNESQRKEIPEEAQTHKRLAIQPIPARSQPEMRSEAIDTIETSDLSWAQCSERPCSQPTSVFSTIFDSDETERRKVMLIRDAFLIARTSHCVGIAFEIFTRLQGALGDSQKRIAFASLNSMLGCHPSALVAALTPDTVPLLVSLPDYDDWAIDLLAKFLQYRAEYLPTSCDQVGSNETASVLAVCCARSGISDPKNLGPSGLRSGLVSIWSRLPTTRDQSPPLLDLLLHWINDSGAALKTKGELFTLLFHQADRLQGGDGWLLSGFLELVSRSRAHCARDLQLVMSFFSFEACVRVLYLLFGLPTWCPRRVMGTWLLLVVYAWEPTKPPRMAPFLQETGIPLYRLLSAYLKCLWEFKPPESSLMKEYLTFFYVPGSEISTELSTLDAAKRLHYLQGAMTETAIRLVLAKCSSPLNTLDGCQLFMYLLDSGPFPLGQCPSTPHLLRSTLQFMRGIEFRLTTPLKAKPKVVSAMRDVIGRIDAVVGGPSDNTRRYSNQLNPFHPDRLSEERETNCEPKTNVSTRQLVSTRALSMVVPSVPSHPPSKILPILIAERNLRHIPVVPSAVKTEGGLPPQPSDFDDPFAFPPNFYGPIAPLIRPVTEPALPVTSTPSGLVNDGNSELGGV
ncbi:MAG: uncharacterized protein KVP18_000067 [Porospora cf. gigantea A]|uniref:uncharacterized protein n=1 Tax=Porospora cf. gigantea A TaxID=2853593 RepID=UPI00355A26E6|nr:MAG: hypothetical protein KVP18_000067 [Porospora cf. gigantea A]